MQVSQRIPRIRRLILIGARSLIMSEPGLSELLEQTEEAYENPLGRSGLSEPGEIADDKQAP